MNQYEIPDPFTTFVLSKYNGYKGMLHDFLLGNSLWVVVLAMTYRIKEDDWAAG
jgi:hypothetical protein